MKFTPRLPVWLAAALLAPVPTIAAHAQTVEGALSQITLYADYMSQNYHETGGLDREIGTIPGAAVDLGYLAPPISGLDNLYIGGEFQYNDGNVKYHGFTLLTDEPINDTTSTRIENGYAEIGKGFYVGSSNFMLVPTVFWGQRDWDRDLVGDDEDENYRTERVGAALHAALAVTDRITLLGRVGVYDTLSPDMQLTSDGEYLKFRQGSEPGVEAEAGLDVLVVGNWHLRGAVDINSFTFGQSNLVPISATEGYREPSSGTTDVSVKVGIGYSF